MLASFFEPLHISVKKCFSVCISLWSDHTNIIKCSVVTHTQKDQITVENTQRRATRLAPSLKWISYSERLKRLRLPTLEYRRKLADINEVYKILNNIDLVNKDKLFEMATIRQMRGHPLKLFKKRFRFNIHANSFSLRVLDDRNALPANVVLALTVNSFKSRLK